MTAPPGQEGPGKRAKWSADQAITAVNSAISHHDLFLYKKRVRKISEFWGVIGLAVGHTGSEVETLFRNLHSEFQKIRVQLHVSGAETVEPVLRNSSELFNAYDEYYQLYYPHGGSTVPKVVMTETTVHIFNEHDMDQNKSNAGQANRSKDESNEVNATEELSGETGNFKTLSTRLNYKKKVNSKLQKLSNQQFLTRTIALQKQDVNLHRRRLQIEKRKVETMEKIASELSTLRAAYCAVHGVQIQALDSEVMAFEE